MIFETGCPGCGLTRGTIYFANGRLVESFAMHPLAWMFSLLILAQIPYRLTCLVRANPAPAGPAGRVTLATTDGYGIYAGTKHPEAAWELVKFLISKDYGRAMARANFLQPARASLVDEWADIIREQFPEKAKDIDIAAFADGHINGYSVTAEIFPNMVDAKRITYDAWDQTFTLGQASVEQMQTICPEIEQLQ